MIVGANDRPAPTTAQIGGPGDHVNPPAVTTSGALAMQPVACAICTSVAVNLQVPASV